MTLLISIVGLLDLCMLGLGKGLPLKPLNHPSAGRERANHGAIQRARCVSYARR